MQKSTAERVISGYNNLAAISSGEDATRIRFLIAGIEHVVFPDKKRDDILDKKHLHNVWMSFHKSEDPILRQRGEWYLKGIDLATSCRRGPQKKDTVLLYHIKVETAVRKALERIRKHFKIKQLSDVRNAAYRMYIDFIGEKSNKNFWED